MGRACLRDVSLLQENARSSTSAVASQRAFGARWVLTDLLLGLLVGVAGLNAVLGRLGLGNGLLDSDEPSVTLGSRLGLKGVLVARDLESKGNSAVLGEVGCVGLLDVRGLSLVKITHVCLPSSEHQRGAPSGLRA